MQGSPSTKMIKTQLGDIAQSFCKTLHQLYHDKCKCFGKGSDRNTRLFQSPTAAARLNRLPSVNSMRKCDCDEQNIPKRQQNTLRHFYLDDAKIPFPLLITSIHPSIQSLCFNICSIFKNRVKIYPLTLWILSEDGMKGWTETCSK